MKGIESRRKRYVTVSARFDEEGVVTPLSVTWEDGRTFEIDRILDRRQATSLKVGGNGVRYLVRILNSDTFLYYENPRWFVEEKIRG
ncbi:MAG: hypothetical protein RR672_11750 [Raoultibacter sp.]